MGSVAISPHFHYSTGQAPDILAFSCPRGQPLIIWGEGVRGDVVKIFAGSIYFRFEGYFFLGEPPGSIFFPGDLPNNFFVIFTTPPDD